jgi:hypothetical protein
VTAIDDFPVVVIVTAPEGEWLGTVEHAAAGGAGDDNLAKEKLIR